MDGKDTRKDKLMNKCCINEQTEQISEGKHNSQEENNMRTGTTETNLSILEILGRVTLGKKKYNNLIASLWKVLAL